MLTEPPASWSALREALAAASPEAIRNAVVVQLEYSQPTADVYNFLTRTLELASYQRHAAARPGGHAGRQGYAGNNDCRAAPRVLL